MGIRGELFSTKFVCDGRTYFFNVKENRTGDVFLSIVESKPTEGETFDRRSIIIFGEYLDGFMKALNTAIPHLKKQSDARPTSEEPPLGRAKFSRPQSFAGRPSSANLSRSPRSENSESSARSPRTVRVERERREEGRAQFQPRAPRPQKSEQTGPARKRIVVKRVKKADPDLNT